MTSFFDGYDFSGFLDLFYRISRGQRLYTDFFFNAGPVHPYIGGLLFRLFGPGMNAMVADTCLVSLFASASAYGLARTGFGLPASMGLSAVSVLFFVGPASFPTYDQHAWVFFVAAILLLRTNLSKSPLRGASLRGIFCGALLALCFLTKANIGAGGTLAVGAILAAMPHRQRSLAWFALSFLITTNLVFVALGTPFEFINTNFLQFSAVERLAQWRHLLDVLHDGPLVIIALMATALGLMGGRAYVRAQWRDFSILGATLATSVFSLWTSSMLPDINLFLVGYQLTFLLLLISRLPRGAPASSERRLYQTALLMTVLVAALDFFTAVERTARVLFYSKRLPEVASIDYTIRSEPLAGWACHRQLCQGMDDAVEYVRQHVPPQDSLFVFPDLTVIYMLTGHESYRHAPYQFMANVVPAPGEATLQFRNAFMENPPQWVVLREATYLPAIPVDTRLQLRLLQLDEYLSTNYKQEWTDGKSFKVLKKI